MRRNAHFFLFVATYIFALLIPHCNANAAPYLQAGFSFDYYGPTTASLPITAQCDTVHLKWARGNLNGLPPIAPYSLAIFSSSSSSPFIVSAGSGPTFDWTMPFAPQTQYQICMYDSVGTSGGCEAIRTVVPSLSSNATCQNVTSLPQLSASISSDNPTSLTQALVINQCNIFSVTPTTGASPFTLTISPSGHPPVNVTSTTMDTINWTVALPEGFPFFTSLASSDGLFWSQGPLYVSGTGATDCLSPGAVPRTTFTYLTIGASLGSLVLGAALGAVIMLLLSRCRARVKPATSRPPTLTKPVPMPAYSCHFQQLQSEQAPIQYPPPPIVPHSPYNIPRAISPEINFLEHDPSSAPPPSRGSQRESIVPFTDTSPSSSHFPLDVKSRRSQVSQLVDRTPSLRSYTTFASTSDLNRSSMSASSRNSETPLMPSSVSSRSSRGSRVGRAPTYVRRAPESHLPALMDDDSMIGSGDMPPQYMRSPAEEEISVSGGALIQ